jgi:hypothetical protein
MSTNVVAENSMVRIGRVLTLWLVALKVAWVATAMGGPAADLISAAERGDATAVKALLAKRADVNAKRRDGRTALMQASGDGHLDVMHTSENDSDEIPVRVFLHRVSRYTDSS